MTGSVALGPPCVYVLLSTEEGLLGSESYTDRAIVRPGYNITELQYPITYM